MELTTRQRAQLRSMANALEPVFHLGKEGIGDNLIKQVDDVLEARELIKGTVQQNAPLSAREACDILCAKTGAQPVQVIGRKMVLYRPSANKPPAIVLRQQRASGAQSTARPAKSRFRPQ
ncbi:RNA-binding protein [Bacteroidia bacterium]|nr:RNA-binding protein [Bacteroidia bacterium]